MQRIPKNALTVLLVLFFLGACTERGGYTRSPVSHPVAAAFLLSGAQSRRTDLQVWGIAPGAFHSLVDLRRLLITAASKAGLKAEEMESTGIKERDLLQLELRSRRDGRGPRVVLLAQAGPLQPGQGFACEAYVVLRMVEEGLLDDLDVREESLRRALASLGARPQTFLTITGEYAYLLDPAEAEQVLDRLLSRLQAEAVERFSDREQIGVFAFAPGLTERIPLGAHTMNLNIALRWDRERRATYLWLGSPLIVED